MKCSACIVVTPETMKVNLCALCSEPLCTRHLVPHFQKHQMDLMIHGKAQSLLKKKPGEANVQFH